MIKNMSLTAYFPAFIIFIASIYSLFFLSDFGIFQYDRSWFLDNPEANARLTPQPVDRRVLFVTGGAFIDICVYHKHYQIDQTIWKIDAARIALAPTYTLPRWRAATPRVAVEVGARSA